MNSQPSCAHSRVELRSENYPYDGPDVPNPDPASPHVGLRRGQMLTRHWWECRDCKKRFVPETAPQPAPDDVAEAIAAVWASQSYRGTDGKRYVERFRYDHLLALTSRLAELARGASPQPAPPPDNNSTDSEYLRNAAIQSGGPLSPQWKDETDD